MQRIEARGRVVHAALAFANQVWALWDEVDDLGAMERFDEELDAAVRDYAVVVGMMECPNLDEEIPADVVKTAKSLYAMERLRGEAPVLRRHLQRVVAAPEEAPRFYHEMPEERRSFAAEMLQFLDELDGSHRLLPGPEEDAGTVVDLTAPTPRPKRSVAPLATAFLVGAAVAISVSPVFHPFG